MSVTINNKIDMGRLLLDYHLITAEQLQKAEEESRERDKEIREILIESGDVTEGAINYVLSSYLDLPYVHITPQMVDTEVAKLIPHEILKRYRMIPVIRVDNELELVMADPTNTAAIKEAESITGCSVKISIGLTEEIFELIDHIFKKEISQLPTPSNEVVVDTSGVVFVYQYLTEAFNEGATHIYIEPAGNEIRVCYRKADRKLEEKKPQPLNLYPAICARLKIMANMDPEQGGLFEEKNIFAKIGDKEIYLRISVLPTVSGDSWTIKILERGRSIPKVEELGFKNELLPQIKKVLNQPSGVIIITGPAGSGRTTTAYSLLAEVDTTKKRVVTIEDVVSYQNNGFIQIESKGLLKSALSQDADLVMVEDMSQGHVLGACFNAALAGRLIVGQMYYPYAFDLLDHLTRVSGNLLIASTLSMVIAQRKIRLLCDSCKEAYSPPPELNMENVTIYRAVGCERCKSTGYQGSEYLYEVLIPDEKVKGLFRQNKGLKEIEEEVSGFLSLKETLKQRLISGKISLEEVV
ncbi:MAG: ATPase, T2SS/T4P/T4SS family [Nitrospirota bacterium]